MNRNVLLKTVAGLFCVVLLTSGMCVNADAGDIAVTNLDSATHEIALSLTAPGSTTLKNGVLRLNRSGGMLAEAVPSDKSWELLIWKRQSVSDPWTFSRAYTVGEMPDTPGRTTLLIRPSTNEVSQAYAVASDPQKLDPLPPIPDWQETPTPALPTCCPPMNCCPPAMGLPQWTLPQPDVYQSCHPMHPGAIRVYRRGPYRRHIRVR